MIIPIYTSSAPLSEQDIIMLIGVSVILIALWVIKIVYAFVIYIKQKEDIKSWSSFDSFIDFYEMLYLGVFDFFMIFCIAVTFLFWLGSIVGNFLCK